MEFSLVIVLNLMYSSELFGSVRLAVLTGLQYFNGLFGSVRLFELWGFQGLAECADS